MMVAATCAIQEDEPPAVSAEEATDKFDARALVGSTIAGRYRVESLLGEGGMGAVYLVYHTGIRKQLALKLLWPKLMRIPSVVARFEREGMAAAHLDHPNIAAASDFGRTEDGRFYLALEYIDGKELRKAIEDADGPMPPGRALFIARQIASALVRAHALGIVHRDLKPENIMLVQRDGHKDFVKVLDFGLALLSRHISDDAAEEHRAKTARKITEQGEIFGTPAYMAPEQTIGGLMDIRTDLYALGVILYELLTGLRPFSGNSSSALIQQHLAVPPPPMKDRARAAKVPADLEALVQRLLAKEPEDRFQKPQELLLAIDEVAAANSLMWPAGTPISTRKRPPAPPPPASPRKLAARQTVKSVRARLVTAWELAKVKVVGKPTTRARIEKALARLRKRLPKRLRSLPLWILASVPLLAMALLAAIAWQIATRTGAPARGPTSTAPAQNEVVETHDLAPAREAGAKGEAPDGQRRQAHPKTNKTLRRK